MNQFLKKEQIMVMVCFGILSVLGIFSISFVTPGIFFIRKTKL